MDSGKRHRSGWMWALLLGSSVLYFFTTNEADNDLWGHVLFGRGILAAGAVPRLDTYAYTTGGHAWTNHEWLSQVVLAATYDVAGDAGLLLLKLAVAAATALLLFALIRRRTARPPLRGALGLVTVAVLARGFAVRPQIFTYCGVALTLWLLDGAQRGQRRLLWCVPPLFLLWANLHGGFALGLAILGLFAAASLLRPPAVAPWLALLLAAAATTLNPYGPRLLVYVWSELSRAHPITEWQAVSPTDASHFVFLGLLGVFVVTLPFARRWRHTGWQTVLALGMGWLALRHQRHTPVFALCAAAPLASQLDDAVSWLASRTAFQLSAVSRRLIAAALGALALLQIGLTASRCQRDGLRITFDPREYPTAVVAAMQHAGLRANLAVPLDWGEYVLWFLAPQLKVSLDGRFATLFPEQVVEDNFSFFGGGHDWRRLVDAYPTDAALVPAGSPCPIGSLADWTIVYRDAVATLYVREGSAAWSSAQRMIGVRASARRGIFP